MHDLKEPALVPQQLWEVEEPEQVPSNRALVVPEDEEPVTPRRAIPVPE